MVRFAPMPAHQTTGNQGLQVHKTQLGNTTMVNRTIAITIPLAIFIGFGGLLACRRDKAEAPGEAPPETAPQTATAPAKATPPSQQTSTAENVSPVKTAPTPIPSENEDTTGASTQTAPTFSFSVTRARNEALRAAQQLLLAGWDNLQSVSAKITLEYDQQEGLKQRRSGEGTYDCMKKDGKTLFRLKSYHNILVERLKEDWVFTGERILKIYDGEFLYTLDELHSGITAIKSRPSRSQLLFIGGPHFLNHLRRFNDFRHLPDEVIDGRPVSVFKGASDSGRVQNKYYIDQESGLLRKLITENETRKSKLTNNFTDIRINPRYAEDHFTFTVPEGVEIQDLTEPDSTQKPSPADP